MRSVGEAIIHGDWAHFHSDRACVECLFGRTKRVFAIINDAPFRMSWTKLKLSLVFCVWLMNFLQRFRGIARSTPAPSFRRVPCGLARNELPLGASVSRLPAPPAHAGDARVGPTPLLGFETLKCRHPQGSEALVQAFAASLPDWDAGGAAPPSEQGWRLSFSVSVVPNSRHPRESVR
jgi:hypothetical protein